MITPIARYVSLWNIYVANIRIYTSQMGLNTYHCDVYFGTYIYVYYTYFIRTIATYIFGTYIYVYHTYIIRTIATYIISILYVSHVTLIVPGMFPQLPTTFPRDSHLTFPGVFPELPSGNLKNNWGLYPARSSYDFNIIQIINAWNSTKMIYLFIWIAKFRANSNM